MKFALTVSLQLQDTLDLFQPLLEALRADDRSPLFLAVAPGLAERVQQQVRHTLLRIIRAGWVAGRRGRVAKVLMDALGELQRGRSAATGTQAAIHLSAAFGALRRAAAALAHLSRSSVGG